MFNIGWDDRQNNSNTAKTKLTTTTDIEFVVSGSVREQAKVRDANLHPLLYLSPAVIWFAASMEAKLQQPRIRIRGDSFKQCTKDELLQLLETEIKELRTAIQNGSDNQVEESVDVANFAMFIAIKLFIEAGVAE